MLSGMRTLSRRQFAGAAASAGYLLRGALDLQADPLGLPIGVWSDPVKQLMERTQGTLRQLSAIGYRMIESVRHSVMRSRDTAISST